MKLKTVIITLITIFTSSIMLADTIDIFYNTDTPIAGFQFYVGGDVTVTGVSGGAAEVAEFQLSTANNTVLAFSLSGITIPVSSGVLVLLEVTGTVADACLSGVIISDAVGVALDAEVEDCLTITCTAPIPGCTDMDACNYDANATVDDESCLELDCAGDCGGSAVVDECDVCDGDGTPCANLSFGAVTDGSLEVYLSNDAPVAGFQFNISGITITGASGGSAEAAGFMVSTSATTVIGFSLSGATIPSGEGVLVNISFTGIGEACLSDLVLSDSSGNAIETELGGCVTIEDCESGIYDCADVCDGPALLGDCGICNGDGSSCVVYIVSEVETAVDETILDDPDFEDNFEALIESALELPEETVEVIGVAPLSDSRDDVQVLIEFTITLTASEFEATDFEFFDDIEMALVDVENDIEDGSIEFIDGCTVPDACNYEPDATVNDGSCSEANIMCEYGSYVCVESECDECEDDPDTCLWNAVYNYDNQDECEENGGIWGSYLEYFNTSCEEMLSLENGCDIQILYWTVSELCPASCDSCICTNSSACNFDNQGPCEYPVDNYDCDGNCLVDIDCAGECGRSSVEDACGVCGGDGIADGACDCAGNVEDCAGECGGSSVEDACGVCGGDGIADGACDCAGNVEDCAGVCGGDAVLSGCDNICNSIAIDDECGVCMGNGCFDQDCTSWPSETFDCDGYNLGDLEFLQAFVDSSNLLIEPLTFGTQTWSNNGRLSTLTIFNMFNGTGLGDSLLIPENIGNMDSLISLIIQNNSSLTGSIPPGIGNLTLLTELNLEYNSLTGTIPDTIQYLVNLSILRLRNNQLMGEIPESICNITAMDWSPSSFSISDNYLCPPYPDCIEDEISYSSQCGAYPEGDDYPEACECVLTGCTDTYSCNFSDFCSDYSCTDDGSCEYPMENYDCNENCIVETDCAGECGGSAIIDDCDNCEGTCMMTNTNYFGIDVTNYIVCGNSENNEIIAGCDGICGSPYLADECGNCSGDCSFNEDGLMVCSDNAGIVKSVLNSFYMDFLILCGEYDTDLPCSTIFETAMNSDWIQTPDCAGECGGSAYTDDCGVCDGDNACLSIRELLIPEDYSVNNIYPNPFNPVTNIRYGLPENVYVKVLIFDIYGNLVQTLINNYQTAGYHSLEWNAAHHSSGLYFVKIIAGSSTGSETNFSKTQKLMLVK